MRVLHMIPDIGIANGVMSVVLNYFHAMPEDIKFDVCYFAEKPQTRQADIEKLGGRVFKIPAPSPKGLLRRDMNRFFSAHKGEWQALHIHAPHFAVFMTQPAKAAGIQKICCHCHSSVYSLKGNQARNKMLGLYSKYFISTRFACSEAAGKVWYGSKKFIVLKNAIDCRAYSYNAEKRNAVRQKMHLSGAFVVGHIGKTDIPQKNHPFILEVFAKIKKQNSSAKLLLMGAEETDALSLLCKQLKIQNSVVFLGARTDISDLLQACDVFLFPSTKEGLPVSVVEAQAAGLPVVLSDSVTDEVCVTENVCWLSLSSSVHEWASKVVELGCAERKNRFEEMRTAGWDIYDSSKQLIAYYRG